MFQFFNNYTSIFTWLVHSYGARRARLFKLSQKSPGNFFKGVKRARIIFSRASKETGFLRMSKEQDFYQDINRAGVIVKGVNRAGVTVKGVNRAGVIVKGVKIAGVIFKGIKRDRSFISVSTEPKSLSRVSKEQGSL